MAIKRLTIELDDSVNQEAATSMPDSFIPKRDLAEVTDSTTTNITQYTREEKEAPGKDTTVSVQGRTYADLIFECSNNPRVMATFLTFLPVPVFAAKLSCLSDLKYPAAVALGLNIVWFISPLLVKWLTRRANASL